MPDVPTISEFNNFPSLDHTNSYMQKCANVGKFDEEPPCPWIKVGKLYVSVTFTGDSSWKPMLEQLSSGPKGHKKFTILTGRHGRQAGGFDTSGNMVAADKAQHHYDEDAKTVKGLDKSLKINLVNVGTGRYTKKNALAQLTRQELQAGSIVFYAWCYSLYSMLTFDPQNETTPYVLGVVNQKVREIVEASFDFVPR